MPWRFAMSTAATATPRGDPPTDEPRSVSAMSSRSIVESCCELLLLLLRRRCSAVGGAIASAIIIAAPAVAAGANETERAGNG